MLKEAVFSSMGISSVQELIAFLYAKKTGKKEIAALARLLTEDMVSKDTAAREITRKAAKELAELTAAVAAGLGAGGDLTVRGDLAAGSGAESDLAAGSGAGDDYPLLLEGSVLLKNRFVREALIAELKVKSIPVCVTDKKADAAYGAASMMRRAG